MDEYLQQLNPMQRQAVQHTEGPLLIFAGAGSGKTRVLTYRIAYLIEHGVSPFRIIAITFTNKAAREMRERVNAVTPFGEQVWVGTFHSTCVQLLRREIHHLGYDRRFSIFDAADSERLIKNCIQELNLDEKQFQPRQVATVISNQKNALISPDAFEQASYSEYRQRKIAEVYSLYQQKLHHCNAMDFDDIIYRTVALFDTVPEVLAKYQDRFQYVMVDEYQDTNTAQYCFVSMLAGGANNLCVVGDDDQSIYGWRGANIDNILHFEKDFPDAAIIKLEQNYRSTQTILNAANAVIAHNYNRTEKALWTENASGERIKCFKACDEHEEALFVATTVKNGVAQGAKLNDFTVLYRNNAQSRAVEDQLVLNGIPYRLFGGVRFYERMEVKDMLSYLKAAQNPADDLAYMRVINVPRRGIGDKTVDCVRAYAVAENKTFAEALREAADIPGLKARGVKALAAFADLMDGCAAFAAEHSVTELIQKIIDETDFLNSLVDGTDEGQGRVENVKELVTKAFEFESKSEDKSLSAFLEEVALVADIDHYSEEAETVTLMTMHSAKGLEFDTVFIVGFEETIFPTSRSSMSNNPNDLEEERRLCYVGFTRAKRQLYITSAVSRMQYGQTVSNAVSRFFKEIPRHLYETVRLEKTNPGLTRTSKPVTPTPSKRKTTPLSSMGQSYQIPVPRNKPLAFAVGERVRQAKYGVGIVTDIRPAGADYEVTVIFENAGIKKFMAHLAKLDKA